MIKLVFLTLFCVMVITCPVRTNHDFVENLRKRSIDAQSFSDENFEEWREDERKMSNHFESFIEGTLAVEGKIWGDDNESERNVHDGRLTTTGNGNRNRIDDSPNRNNPIGIINKRQFNFRSRATSLSMFSVLHNTNYDENK